MEGDGVIDPGMEYVPPPAGSAASGTVVGGRKKVRAPEQIKQEVESEEEKPDRMDIDSEDTDSNTSLQTRAREKRKSQLEKDRKPKGAKYTPVSIYEEKLLLKRLEACPSAVAMTPEARRLKRKLIVRQATGSLQGSRKRTSSLFWSKWNPLTRFFIPWVHGRTAPVPQHYLPGPCTCNSTDL